MIETPSPAPNPPPPPPGFAAPETNGPVAALLKNPRRLADSIAARQNVPSSIAALFAVGLAGHAAFGLAIGLFSGWTVAAMDAVKMPLAGAGALLLCFPSLYVFSCVAGSPLSIPQSIALGSAAFAMVGLVLLALAPVAWLFAVSTANLPFVALLAFLLWLVALGFAARFAEKLGANSLFRRRAGVNLWLCILALATLQMATCLRPMLAQPENGWRDSGKLFFLAHFAQTLETD